MKKPLTLSLFASGLVWVTTGPAMVCLDNRYLHSGTAVTCQSISR
jgi:hypothetical protein